MKKEKLLFGVLVLTMFCGMSAFAGVNAINYDGSTWTTTPVVGGNAVDVAAVDLGGDHVFCSVGDDGLYRGYWVGAFAGNRLFTGDYVAITELKGMAGIVPGGSDMNFLVAESDGSLNVIFYAHIGGGWQQQNIGGSTLYTDLINDDVEAGHCIGAIQGGGLMAIELSHDGTVWTLNTTTVGATSEYTRLAPMYNQADAFIGAVAGGGLDYIHHDGTNWVIDSIDTSEYNALGYARDKTAFLGAVAGGGVVFIDYDGTTWTITPVAAATSEYNAITADGMGGGTFIGAVKGGGVHRLVWNSGTSTFEVTDSGLTEEYAALDAYRAGTGEYYGVVVPSAELPHTDVFGILVEREDFLTITAGGPFMIAFPDKDVVYDRALNGHAVMRFRLVFNEPASGFRADVGVAPAAVPEVANGVEIKIYETADENNVLWESICLYRDPNQFNVDVTGLSDITVEVNDNGNSMEDLVTFGNPIVTMADNTEYYLEQANIGRCVDPSPADLNGDCQVTILDFAILAADWLGCYWDDPTFCK